MRILQSGEYEPLKAGLHGLACALAVTFAGYNAAAMVARRRVHRHLLINTIGYAALAFVEWRHVQHHRR